MKGDTITVETTVYEIAYRLTRDGFKVGEVSEMDDHEDASILLSATVHVQVGAGYAIVNVETLGADGELKSMRQIPSDRTSYSSLVKALRTAT